MIDFGYLDELPTNTSVATNDDAEPGPDPHLTPSRSLDIPGSSSGLACHTAGTLSFMSSPPALDRTADILHRHEIASVGTVTTTSGPASQVTRTPSSSGDSGSASNSNQAVRATHNNINFRLVPHTTDFNPFESFEGFEGSLDAAHFPAPWSVVDNLPSVEPHAPIHTRSVRTGHRPDDHKN